MSLSSGARLGPYEILSLLGAGGMGEVYRARDTKLKRDVAVKVLPELVASDPDRLARFHREAEVLAALNHPHIAHIYGFEDSDSTHALVMELVEGPTLADRIAHGPIPVAEALPIAKQIAEALETAHEQGVIHRDLKPANIKVREDGTVKVLDFGLAKMMDRAAQDFSPAGPAGPGGSKDPRYITNSPTLTSPALMTGAGVILGTAAYMSPEQAKGRPADKRSDVWAFGCVLYEMLAGKRPFAGEDITDTIVSLMSKAPDWSALPADLPAAVVTLLRRCLDKDRHRRIGDIAVARFVLDDTAAAQATTAATPGAAPSRGWIGWSVAAVMALAFAVVGWLYVREAPAAVRRVHLSLAMPDNAPPGLLAISPDGRWLATADQPRGITVRSLDTGEAKLIKGTDGVRGLFWSPDSRTIGFFSQTDRTLKTVSVSGGVPQVLCDDVTDTGASGTWSRTGTIVFSVNGRGLVRVAASGGACEELTKDGPRRPVFLPDGEHFLYVQFGTDPARRGLSVGSLRDPAGKRLLPDLSSGLFVPDGPGATRGRLLFEREQTLMALAFDTHSLEVSGDPVTVADNVAAFTYTSAIAASVTRDGTLAYLANTRSERQFVWYDRSGADVGRGPKVGIQTSGVSLSPDGTRATLLRPDAQGRFALWVEDLERNQETRLTAPPIAPGAAVWSPDAQRLAFGSPSPSNGIYVKSVAGAPEELLAEVTNRASPSDWSRDGRWLVFTETDPKTGSDIWLLSEPGSPSEKRTRTPLIHTPATESQGQLSPDGKWLAYFSDEGGTGEVYLRPFNGAGPLSNTKWQVSTSGVRSVEPRWRADSKELFYVESVSLNRRRLMAVVIGTTPSPAGPARPLFEFQTVGTVPQQNNFLYSPSADGQRFLIDVFASDVQPSLELILNWASGAK